MKRLILFLITGLLLFAQAGPVTIADKTGDASVHQLSATVILARTVDLTALAANSGTCRVGDSSTSSTQGQPIEAGGSYHYEMPQLSKFASKDGQIDLSRIYYLCASSDKLAVQYVP